MRITLSFLFLAKISAQAFFENAGLAINELDPIELYNHPREVKFIRTFSTRPTNEILHRIEQCISPDETHMEKDTRVADYVKTTAKKIAHDLEKHWESAMMNLQTIAGRSERSAWDTTKSAVKFLYNSPFLRSVLQTTLPGLGNYLSAMTDQDHHEKLELLEHKVINNTNLILQSNNVLLSRLDLLEIKHCEVHNQIFLDNELNHMISEIESEILSVSLGKIPHKADFVRGLLESCFKLGNTPKFCHRALNANLISLEFKGLTFESEDSILISYVSLQIPIEKTSLSKVSRIEIINLGAWLADQFFKLDIEGTFIRGIDNQLFELDEERCRKNFCPFEAVRIHDTKCLGSVLANSTEGCEMRFQNAPVYCEVRPFGPNFLVNVPDGDIIYNTHQPITTKAIKNQTILISEQVTLSCNGPSGTKNIALFDEILTFSSHYKAFKPLALDLTQTSRSFASHLQILSDISNLKDSEDSILIGKSDLKISLVVLLSACLSVTVSALLPHVARGLRSLIVALLSRFRKGKLQRKGQSVTVEKQETLDRRRSVRFEPRPLSLVSRPKSFASRPESVVSINLDGFVELN
jgi:hypothetical protein